MLISTAEAAEFLSSGATELVPLALYTLVAVGLIGFLLLAAWWLGAKRESESKKIAYESGVLPTGNARLAYPVPFYLVAIFFIIFDVEAVFIFTWAVVWDTLGFAGLIQITMFIVVLLLGLIWLWIKGGLDWGPSAGLKERAGNKANHDGQ